MNQPFITEAEKAFLAEIQTLTGDDHIKVIMEFAIQGYPDLFREIRNTVKNIGIEPAAFAQGYIAAVATNLASLKITPGCRAEIAKLYGKALEQEFLSICTKTFGEDHE